MVGVVRACDIAVMRTVKDFGPTAEGHLWARVERGGEQECWKWSGRLTDRGYGEFTFAATDGRTKKIRAHRAVWELLRGPIPFDAPLDHLCHNRACVNPAHLEPVTPDINNRRRLTRVSDLQEVRIPDEMWDALERDAQRAGVSLRDLVISRLAGRAVYAGC